MKKIVLHQFDDPSIEFEFDADLILDIEFAKFSGGSKLILADGVFINVDENPNHVALKAGRIEGEHCAVGSHSGMHYWRG